MRIKNLLLRWLPLIALSAAAGGLIWQKQNLYDWWRLRGYSPPAKVVELADHTTMNSRARRLFYVQHPVLEDKKDFNEHCRQIEASIVLGCFINGRDIYIYDVKDPRLAGILEVTAAHELLHAAYERLGETEKSGVNQMLNDFFAKLDNERIKKTIEAYRQRDPSVVDNELHSIIGTEVRALPPDLENYYKRYFDDRQKIVGYLEQYEQAFSEIKNRVAAYDAQLADIKAQIEANEAELKRLSEEINRDRARLDAMLAAGDEAGYNTAVPGFNTKVRRYNNLSAATRSLIARYNRLVGERNALATEEQGLIEALDSRLPPQDQE